MCENYENCHYTDDEQMSDRLSVYQANGGKEINARVEELADQKGVS